MGKQWHKEMDSTFNRSLTRNISCIKIWLVYVSPSCRSVYTKALRQGQTTQRRLFMTSLSKVSHQVKDPSTWQISTSVQNGFALTIHKNLLVIKVSESVRGRG